VEGVTIFEKGPSFHLGLKGVEVFRLVMKNAAINCLRFIRFPAEMELHRFIAAVRTNIHMRTGTSFHLSAPRRINIALNWFEELKHRVPAKELGKNATEHTDYRICEIRVCSCAAICFIKTVQWEMPFGHTHTLLKDYVKVVQKTRSCVFVSRVTQVIV